MSSTVYNPLATYRVQLHKNFSFVHLKEIIPYLHQLGIKTIYASPIFSATPGSEHGYDGINPLQINPEIGTLEEFREIRLQLKQLGMGWLQDFVPNHMAYHPANPWLADIFEKGTYSAYYSFFDIDWQHPALPGKLMMPFFTAPVAEDIENGNWKLTWQHNRLCFVNGEWSWPLYWESYQHVLGYGDSLRNDFSSALSKFRELPQHIETSVFRDQWEHTINHLKNIYQQDVARDFIHEHLQRVNGDKQFLLQMMEQQCYHPCHWQQTDKQINYRRFFTVNGLICTNMNDENVFNQYHSFIRSLCEEDLIQGIRIDHVDGLFDPANYLQRLRALVGESCYIVVEKILEAEEQLPASWPIQGTTGYDFLAQVNNLLTFKKKQKGFQRFYKKITEHEKDIRQQVFEKKGYILEQHMQGELDNLVRLYQSLMLAGSDAKGIFHDEIVRNAFTVFLVHCPVYRFYFGKFPLNSEEVQQLENLLDDILQQHPFLTAEVGLLNYLFLTKPQHTDKEYNEAIETFFNRCMQFCGPLMAKGVEDTLMYTHHLFIAHNEVGDAPVAFGMTINDFHQKMQQRLQQWPLTMNTTATHDTKRGEDARARLNVLPELGDQWFKQVKAWYKMNREFKSGTSPDINDEYFIYQSLVANYPLEKEAEEGFVQRFNDYLVKALREGKQRSNWAAPDTAYEGDVIAFVGNILQHKPFTKSLRKLLGKISHHGLINSISQVIIKCMAPGVPDIYQGTELWDFSFVDPDNRRKINYTLLQDIANKHKENKCETGWLTLWDNRKTGAIKWQVTHAMLKLRHLYPDLFLKGKYIPLEVTGALQDKIFAFALQHRESWVIIVLPMGTASLMTQDEMLPYAADLADTSISIPFHVVSAKNELSGKSFKVKDKIWLHEIFTELPFGVLHGKTQHPKRQAGLLLHISSLPSAFGIGDLGAEAYRFADFLYQSNQRVWQVLPLNPVDASQGFSPYSSVSSRAGNSLLVSPELLVEDGLLDAAYVRSMIIPSTAHVDFEKAFQIKNELLYAAWQKFKSEGDETLQDQFDSFCKDQQEWIIDFSLYMVIRKEHQHQPWSQWPSDFKERDKKTLNQFTDNFREAIEFTKWVQFIFDRQWKRLKQYCNDKGILLFGDLPFYVSHDSADVWAHQELFKLDDEGMPLAMAGVPPDFFSADGQLWGMPVFDWDAMLQQGYTWWAERLRKNMEMFDWVRLDHFRAFSAYWEVPAGEQTAANGKWVKGPGTLFFREMEKQLKGLPFIAEDLGDIDRPVYKLRDKFSFPGMKVLQFAFGDQMPSSIFIPHNYEPNFITYTGTHDNDTLLGWWQQADAATREQVMEYAGQPIDEHNLFHVLGKMLYASIANTVIFPVQDLLSLGAEGRMNTPSIANDNWTWRVMPGQITGKEQTLLKQWTRLYNR